MKKSAIKISLMAAVMTVFMFSVSCNRRDKDRDNDTELAGDHAQSEAIFNDVLSIADDASDKQTGDHLGLYKTSSACATVTHDTLSTPHQLIIDFGPTNCLCNDGRYRRGKILVSYTGNYRDSGSVRSFSFDQYFINNHQVLGTKTVSNMGTNASGQTWFSIQVNGTILKASGDTIQWNSNRTRTWLQGESTPARLDDVYQITGSASGTKGGHSYTITIIQPLVKALACDWISAGSFELQPSGKPLRVVDFGTGTCDNQATVTILGVVYPITLP